MRRKAESAGRFARCGRHPERCWRGRRRRGIRPSPSDWSELPEPMAGLTPVRGGGVDGYEVERRLLVFVALLRRRAPPGPPERAGGARHQLRVLTRGKRPRHSTGDSALLAAAPLGRRPRAEDAGRFRVVAFFAAGRFRAWCGVNDRTADVRRCRECTEPVRLRLVLASSRVPSSGSVVCLRGVLETLKRWGCQLEAGKGRRSRRGAGASSPSIPCCAS